MVCLANEMLKPGSLWIIKEPGLWALNKGDLMLIIDEPKVWPMTGLIKFQALFLSVGIKDVSYTVRSAFGLDPKHYIEQIGDAS